MLRSQIGLMTAKYRDVCKLKGRLVDGFPNSCTMNRTIFKYPLGAPLILFFQTIENWHKIKGTPVDE